MKGNLSQTSLCLSSFRTMFFSAHLFKVSVSFRWLSIWVSSSVWPHPAMTISSTNPLDLPKLYQACAERSRLIPWVQTEVSSIDNDQRGASLWSVCWTLRLVWHAMTWQGSDTVSQTPEDTLTEYKAVFEGFESFPGVHKIQLKPDVNPVIHLPRKVSISLCDKLENKLERMESLDVIAKVMVPSNWVNPIATPEKQRTGALRVCLDSRDLNQAVKREHYPLPTLEVVRTLTRGGT